MMTMTLLKLQVYTNTCDMHLDLVICFTSPSAKDNSVHITRYLFSCMYVETMYIMHMCILSNGSSVLKKRDSRYLPGINIILLCT